MKKSLTMDKLFRDQVIEELRKEVIGPANIHIDEDSKEEFLIENVGGPPANRYGAAILFPQVSLDSEPIIDGEKTFDEPVDEDEVKRPKLPKTSDNLEEEVGELEDEGLSQANHFRPSAAGMTARFKLSETSHLSIVIRGAFYQKSNEKKVVSGTERKSTIWNRKSFERKLTIAGDDLTQPNIQRFTILNIEGLLVDGNEKEEVSEDEEWLSLSIINRTAKEEIDTLTFSLINKKTDSNLHSSAIFQVELEVISDSSEIQPFKEANSHRDDAKNMALLYKSKPIYAIGHGCSVNWDDDEKPSKIFTDFFPTYEIPAVEPAGGSLDLSMYALSHKGDWPNAKKEILEKFPVGYEKWIEDTYALLDKVPHRHQNTARANLEKCKKALNRIQEGVDILLEAEEDSDIVQAFRWMNYAMLWQQQRSKLPLREWQNVGTNAKPNFELQGTSPISLKEFSEQYYMPAKKNQKGRWRPFQLAFVLMNIAQLEDPHHEDREVVDLIWFPTGGGKTEAYLGLAGFTIFYRRLQGLYSKNRETLAGTTILMRYTLRLLTSQQFERASSLICACELIRRKESPQLGEEPISIGLWIGGSSTPNTTEDARRDLRALMKDNKKPYKLVLLKCPCCGAAIGPEKIGYGSVLQGVREVNGSTRFACENKACEFSHYENRELPIYVVDDDIYEKAPTLIIGTVDKFASLAWKPETYKLFGFRGNHPADMTRIKPPELIIQDELHLISGALGSIVGLYETMIQTLCTDYGLKRPQFYPKQLDESGIKPKVVASSATITQADEQVKSLYSAENLEIFPPQALNFGDTYFSKENKEKPGRKYVGVLAPGYPSAQTTVVRIYASILQIISNLNADVGVKNYYWTLVAFFNSLRELGIAVTLAADDIPGYLNVLHRKLGLSPETNRYLNESGVREMTSRISGTRIPKELKKLEEDYTGEDKNYPVDLLLATNMIATGVDVSRLGLMVVNGQPKTTAEYIQASSRVGRDAKGPGLVLTLFNTTKPRDKSRYEQFRAYHSRIYSFVEPTSVTPFSINSRDRALHAVVVSLARVFEPKLRDSPENINHSDEVFDFIRAVITKRVDLVDPYEKTNTLSLIDSILRKWKNRSPFKYGNMGGYGDDYYLLYPYGSFNEPGVFSTLTSMRSVDASALMHVFQKS